MTLLRRPIAALLARQQRCPTGPLGWIVGERMARQHEVETRWTIGLLDLAPADRVLEVGCGAGHGLALAVARLTDGGGATGIDLSRVMIRAAARRNARAVAAGRVAVRRADVDHLPFDDALFDKVFGVHTVYFWPDAAGAVAEIARVLTPGGRVALTLAPGRVGLPDDEWTHALVEERLLPAMRRAGLAAARVVRGPDSRQFRTVAVVGER